MGLFCCCSTVSTSSWESQEDWFWNIAKCKQGMNNIRTEKTHRVTIFRHLSFSSSRYASHFSWTSIERVKRNPWKLEKLVLFWIPVRNPWPWDDPNMFGLLRIFIKELFQKPRMYVQVGSQTTLNNSVLRPFL